MKKLHIGILCALLGGEGLSAQTYSLSECEELAAKNNYALKNSQLETQIASQAQKEAYTAYFPSVSASGMVFAANDGMAETEVSLEGVLPEPLPLSFLEDGTVLSLTASQPVFTGGRIMQANKLARVGEMVSDLQLELTEDEVIYRTREYFWQIVSLKEKLKTLEVTGKLLERLHREVTLSVQAGLTNRNDLLRVELQQQETASNRLTLENALNISKMLLSQYAGLETDHFEISYPAFDTVPPPERYFMDPLRAVETRKESRLLEQQLTAVRLNTRMKAAERLPSLGVGAGLLHHNLMGERNDAALVYATVSVPLSGWWGGTHAVKQSRIREQQTENDRQNSIELMRVETSQTWHELQEAYDQIRLARRSVESARENLRLNTDFYRAGTVPLSDLLDAQVLQQQSYNQLSDAHCRYQLKLTRYLQVTGRS
ncbi:MAG: TolC family protein [Mangrovibacterium sp.]